MENKLNKVADGYVDETVFDSKALYQKDLMDEQFTEWDLVFNWCTDSVNLLPFQKFRWCNGCNFAFLKIFYISCNNMIYANSLSRN